MIPQFVIHTPLEKQAEELLEDANKKGLTWFARKDFSKPTEWGIYKENTCYDIINGKFLELSWCQENRYQILSMGDYDEM